MLAEAVWKNIQEKVGTDMIQYPTTSVVSIHEVVISVTIFLSVQSAQKKLEKFNVILGWFVSW